jgi:ABC-2 type transport system permease protein
MSVYLRVARLSARTVLAHRVDYFFGMVGLIVQLAAAASLWTALLSQGGRMGGFTLPEMKAYLLVTGTTAIIGTAVCVLALAERIRDGHVALDLVKPVDPQKAAFAQTCGGVAIEVLLVTAVGAGFLLAAGPIPGPADVWLLSLSLVFVLPIRFSIVYITATLVFWTRNFHGVIWARNALITILAGTLVPLRAMPVWFQSVATVLPFAGLTSTPAIIYLGKAHFPVLLIALQAVWAVVLWWLARWTFRSTSRRIAIDGG